MSKITIGKVLTQQKIKRGWLVGHFLPSSSPFKDEKVEIYYKTFKTGDKSDRLHLHPKGKEYLVVISGKAIMRIGEKKVILQKGDYVAIPNNTPDKIVKVLKKFTIMGIRYPSVPNNKIMLEQHDNNR